jgi:fructose-1,6-bisphosphatase I
MSSHNESHSGPGGSEAINTEIITLTRFLTEEQTKHKEATGDFTYVEQANRATLAC